MQILGIESCMFILTVSWQVNKSGRNGTIFSVTCRYSMSLEFRQVQVPEGSEPETKMQVLLQDGGGGGRAQGQAGRWQRGSLESLSHGPRGRF